MAVERPNAEDREKASTLLLETDGYEPSVWAVGELYAAIRQAKEIHRPWGIYTECGHQHTEAELEDPASSVHQVDLVGLVCAEGLMYRVCRNCCVEPGWTEGYQLEHCATKHTHTPQGPVCPTTAALDGVDMPDEERWT